MKNLTNFTFNLIETNELLAFSRKLNIFLGLVAILIGIVGHSLIIFVFSQKRFRTNSSNVFIFCLAMNDAAYLVVHFFDDTLRTYIDLYLINTTNLNTFNRFLISINVTDKYAQCCKLVNYLRYVLRFVSPYILVLLTFQRLLLVFKPLSSKFIFKKYAWGIVLSIVIVSLVVNVWTLFFYDLNWDQDNLFCDVNRSKSKTYFKVSAVYIFITILMPVFFVFISNLLIIIKLNRTDIKRRSFLTIANFRKRVDKNSTATTNVKKSMISNEKASYSLHSQQRVKPYYFNINSYANRARHTQDDSKNLSRLLFLISTLFVTFNLPYLLSWFWTFHEINQIGFDALTHENLFAILQLCEVIYNCHFSMLFFVYCASGSKFRHQLKYSGMLFTSKN